ncbi:MAG: hypothetical protein K5762_07475 [Bacilli bacterium]|nr:hypothetical protein [Bacilli bacterium]
MKQITFGEYIQQHKIKATDKFCIVDASQPNEVDSQYDYIGYDTVFAGTLEYLPKRFLKLFVIKVSDNIWRTSKIYTCSVYPFKKIKKSKYLTEYAFRDRRRRFYRYQTDDGNTYDQYEDEFMTRTWEVEDKQISFKYYKKTNRLFKEVWKYTSENFDDQKILQRIFLGKVNKIWSKRVFIDKFDREMSPYKDEKYKVIYKKQSQRKVKNHECKSIN